MHLTVRLPKVQPTEIRPPTHCPLRGRGKSKKTCSGTRFKLHQVVCRKPLGDTRFSQVLCHRYRCLKCHAASGPTHPASPTITNPIPSRVSVCCSTSSGLSYQGVADLLESLLHPVCKATVYNNVQAAGQQARRLCKQRLKQQAGKIKVVGIDFPHVKCGGREQIVAVAMAVQVATRLWLGAVVSTQRDMALITTLVQLIRTCALCRPLLICVDGWRAYVGAIRTVFREAIPTGARGRPALRPWDGMVIGQVVKQYAHGHVVSVARRIVQGTEAQVSDLLHRTQGGGVINTAYIERLNATFRARLAGLVRRGRSLLRQTASLRAGVYWVGTVYNFCTYHQSLRIAMAVGRSGRRHWVSRTPAMAAGLADHRWTVHELLMHRIPPPRWSPPKRRGRPSNVTKQLVAQWSR